MTDKPAPVAHSTPPGLLFHRQGVRRDASPESDSVSALLQRMRSGDRVAAAHFVIRYESRIRRRIRGKLGPAMRSIFDSQDILSTLGRRLDHIVRSGRLGASSEDELWALVFRTAEQAVREKARAFRRSRNREVQVGLFTNRASSLLRQAQHDSHAVGFDFDFAMRCLANATDRQILSLWMSGAPLSAIAATLDFAPATVRKRWERIKRRLYARLGPEVLS